MKASPPDDPAELVRRLREQLILAQVRIMELEDERDDLGARRAEGDGLLQQAQTLADTKLEALAHLEKVHADLEAEFVHLRHMQHVTNEALNDTRARLEEATVRLNEAASRERQHQDEIATLRAAVAARDADLADLHHRAADLGGRLDALDARARQLDADLAAVQATAQARLTRIGELDAELRAMKASRSWRWTTMLRSLERLARRKPPRP